MNQTRGARGRLQEVSPEARLADGYIPEPNSGCWLWDGPVAGKGYGVLSVRNRQTYAHRLSWELANGRAPLPPEVVRHKCDVPACVNPAHLEIGTTADNSADRVIRGRAHQKLSADDVRAIYIDPRSKKRIAKDFGVSRTMVRAIKERRSWAHLTGPHL
jgi:hypothetical protein